MRIAPRCFGRKRKRRRTPSHLFRSGDSASSSSSLFNAVSVSSRKEEDKRNNKGLLSTSSSHQEPPTTSTNTITSVLIFHVCVFACGWVFSVRSARPRERGTGGHHHHHQQHPPPLLFFHHHTVQGGGGGFRVGIPPLEHLLLLLDPKSQLSPKKIVEAHRRQYFSLAPQHILCLHCLGMEEYFSSLSDAIRECKCTMSSPPPFQVWGHLSPWDASPFPLRPIYGTSHPLGRPLAAAEGPMRGERPPFFGYPCCGHIRSICRGRLCL